MAIDTPKRINGTIYGKEFFFIRFANSWQGHGNSVTLITAVPSPSVPALAIDHYTGDYVPYS